MCSRPVPFNYFCHGAPQGRNQERANWAIAPPQNFCKHDGIHVLHMKRFFTKLCYLYVNFSRQLFRIRMCCVILDETINQSMYHASETPSTEPKTSFEALAVKWNHPFHESDVVVINVTLQSRNPLLPIRDVLAKKVWGVGNAPKNLAILKQLWTHFKAKHEKGVGRPFPRVPALLHPCYQSRLLLHSCNFSWFAAKSSS